MSLSLEELVLQEVERSGGIADTGSFAKHHELDHKKLTGLALSLESSGVILKKDMKHSKDVLTAEARSYIDSGATCEVQYFNAIRPEGTALQELQAQLGDAGKKGHIVAMSLRWVKVVKGQPPLVQRAVSAVEDKALAQLVRIDEGQDLPEDELKALKKRKLVAVESWTTFQLTKGPKFVLKRKQLATDLTAAMLKDKSWSALEFKPYNFEALGSLAAEGSFHPLLKVRSQFRNIFLQMGFQEMPTNNYVESSFWNFDALFQPQQHPARDAHDTFFVTHPERTPLHSMPAEYVQRVKATHQSGDFGGGSTGYGSPWKESEAEKNLLRTHTTAVSSRMLYRLVQEGFRPAKYFSIDRVFRNEAIDRTHLAEFHQIEGLVCDRGLTLQHLMGVLDAFFRRLGMEQIRFKPAYNPYTEPSMEIFGYSPELKKWIELGNSGMFRPEMLLPMGLPEDVKVIAFGLGLERPTMIIYGIDNIRDLFGHKVSLDLVRRNPICRLGW